MFNLLGEPVDNLPAPETKERWEIHREPPTYEAKQSASNEILETGIKVIDLIAPYLKRRKDRSFSAVQERKKDGAYSGAYK